jgi:hypothetical protein
MGWTSHFQTQMENFCNDEFNPARVVGVRKNNWFITDYCEKIQSDSFFAGQNRSDLITDDGKLFKKGDNSHAIVATSFYQGCC